MRSRLRRAGRRPSPALAISILALMVALGGTGYAAINLPANSVGTAQLRNGAVTGRKVHRHSLTASDFARGQLPRGPAGTPGKQGSPGVAGTARAFGVVTATGVAVQARSKGIASIAHPAVGVYCIALQASINPAATTIVATPDESDPTSTSKAISQVDSSAADCPAGRLEVIMRRVSIDTSVSPPQIVDHHTDNGFSFVVP